MDLSFEQLVIAEIASLLHILIEEAEQVLAVVLYYNDISAELDKAMDTFSPNYETWLITRKKSIDKLEELADNLDTHHKNVNITNITASSVGATGGVLAISSTVLSIFTFGLALPLAVVGTTMAAVGGITGLGATVAEYGITKDRCSHAQKLYDDDMKQTEQIVNKLNKILGLTKQLEEILKVLKEVESDLSNGLNVECQAEHQAMLVAEGKRLGPYSDVEYLTKEQATYAQIQSQGAGDDMSKGVSSHGDRQECQKLKSSDAMVVHQTKSIKTLVGRRDSSDSFEAAAVGDVTGAGALTKATSKTQQKLMTSVGQIAGGVALPKLVGSVRSVTKAVKLARNVGKVGKVSKLAGNIGKMGKMGSAGTSAVKIGSVGSKIGGTALSVVGLGFDIWTVVTTAKDMSEGSKSPAGIQLRNQSGEMKKQQKEISEYKEQAKRASTIGLPAVVVIVNEARHGLTRNLKKRRDRKRLVLRATVKLRRERRQRKQEKREKQRKQEEERRREEERRQDEELTREHQRRQIEELRREEERREEEQRREEQRRREEELRREEQRRQEEELRREEQIRQEEELRREEERRQEEQRREERRRWEEELRREEERRQEEELRREEQIRQEEELRREEERRQEEELRREEDRRKEEQRRWEEQRKREEHRRHQKRERQRRRKLKEREEKRKQEEQVGQKTKYGTAREALKQRIKELDYADRRNADKNIEETQALVEELKVQEYNLKKTELEVELSLTNVKNRCSPLEYAKWRNNRKQVSHQSHFRNTEQSVNADSEASSISQKEFGPQNEYHNQENACLSDIFWMDPDSNMYDFEFVTGMVDNSRHKALHQLLKSQISDRQSLVRMQTCLFSRYSQTMNLNDMQADVILDALSHVSISLNDQECAKFTKALSLLCTVSEYIDQAIQCSYQKNVLGIFFRGLILCCYDCYFYSGACVTQCVHKYLLSCEKGIHYDEDLLQMMAADVDASLKCVFTTVDDAIIHQRPANLQLLKQQVHLIQTYKVPLKDLEHAHKLEQLQQLKRKHDREIESIKLNFLYLNSEHKELWNKLERCLCSLEKIDKSQEACDECLRNDVSKTVEALKRIQFSSDPDDITLAMKTLSYAVYKFMGYRWMPRRTQVLSVCMLLLSQEQKINRLLEVLTGEGKSCIIAMFAAALCMQGKKVDIITSSPVLARRDAHKWAKFFEIFNVDNQILNVAHNTEIPDLLLLSQTEADRKRIECYQSSVVYGTVSSFSADILREEFEMRKVRSHRGSTAAIVDEVDMLMLDEGVQFTYLSHQAILLRHIEPVLAMVWSTVGQHAPFSTADGDILYAGVPKSFHNVIYEGVQESESKLEHPSQLLQSLLNNKSNSQHQQVLEMLLEAQDAESALKTFNSEDIALFIKQLNEAFSFKVMVYTSTTQNVLEAVSVGQDEVEKEMSKVSVLLANEGILYPLYTQDELTQGIEAMISSQCDLPNQVTTTEDQQVLHSEDGNAFLCGVPCHLNDILSTNLDATELLKFFLKLDCTKSKSTGSAILNSQEGKLQETMESFLTADMLSYLRYLEEQIPRKFPAYYILDSEKQLVKQSKNETEETDIPIQGILVMDNGILCPLLKVPASQALSTVQQPQESDHLNELFHTSDGVFKRGLADYFHRVICLCVDPILLLSLLMSTNDGSQEKLRIYLVKSNQEKYTATDLLPIIHSVERYLACRIVVYIQNEQNNLILHRSCTTQDMNSKGDPEVPVLLMDKGMLCKLHPKETVEIPQSLKDFVANQLPTYINSAFTALQMTENREYLVKDGKQIIPVDFLNSGVIEVNKKWGGGLQQMLEMKHHLQISPMSVVTNFMSHVEFFKRYTREGALYGLSGTVGGSTDAVILEELYRLQICKIPTFRQSLRYERDAIFVKGGRKEWLEQIHFVLKDITEPKSYAPDLHGAAALVLCEDIRTAKEIQFFLSRKMNKEPQLYNGEDSTVSIEETPKVPGDIIIATNLAGRGTDISVTEEVNDSGGLLCLMTFVPRNRRVELQAFGRTARCGNPGSVQYVLPVSTLPCNYRDGLEITALRELREIEENQRLQHMLRTDIKEVEVREALFRRHCDFLKSIHRDIENRMDKHVVIDTVNENWGQWLQMKQQDVGLVPKNKLLKDLEMAQERWRPLPNMSPEHLPESNFHHLVKFGNQLARANRESAEKVDGMYFSHLIKLGRQLVTNEQKNAREAKKYYDKAIDLESKFTMIAHYNRACCSLCIRGDRYIANSIKDLEVARKQLTVFLDEVTVVLQCAMLSRHVYVQDSDSNYLLKQMEVRMQVLQYFGNKIDKVLTKLKDFEKDSKDVEVIPANILKLIPEADAETNEELYGLFQLGLEFVFTVKEKPRFCWEGLAVFALGLLQIAAGVLLTVLTSGALSSFGMGLISEGVSDCIDGIAGMVTGEWDWKGWGISKACSIGVSIACGGVGKFVKASKAIKELPKGADVCSKCHKVMSLAASKTKTVVKDLKTMSRVAKGSWGTAMKTLTKNAAKLVAKEVVVQGAMNILSEMENKAIKFIFDKVGESIAQSIQPSLTQSFLSSVIHERSLGLVVDSEFVSKLSESYAREDQMDPVLREKTKQYFAYAAEEVVCTLVQTSTTFNEVAGHFRSLLPQISGHLNGRAAAVSTVIELGFVTSSLYQAVSQLKDLTDKFLQELKNHCYKSFLNHKGDSETVDKTHLDERYALKCVEELKKELAQCSAIKLGEAVASVLLEKLTWMVNRGLSITVNKVAAKHLNMALNVEGTKEIIRAGQKANYIRSMPMGPGTKLDHHDVTAVISHSNKILEPSNPGTIAELRVAAEIYDCNVVIEDEKGRRNCSLSSSSKDVNTKVILVHLPQDVDHPLGHYQVKVDGKVIQVPSESSGCMYEAFAYGLNAAKKDTSFKCDQSIDGNEVRNKVSQQIKHNPQLWHEHYKRREYLERIKEGNHFLLRGAGKKVNNETRLIPRKYNVSAISDKITKVMYTQENGLELTVQLEFDKKPEGTVQNVNRKTLQVKDLKVLSVKNGANVKKMTILAQNADFVTNENRCAHTQASQNQICFPGDQRDLGGSAPVSFHLVASAAGANAGVYFGNSIVASEHYNKKEKQISREMSDFIKTSQGGTKFDCKVIVHLEDLIPTDTKVFLKERNESNDIRNDPDRHVTNHKAVEGRFKAVEALVQQQMGSKLTLQRAKQVTWQVLDSEKNVVFRRYLGRDTELYLHSSLHSKQPSKATKYSGNKDLCGAKVLSSAQFAGVQTDSGSLSRSKHPCRKVNTLSLLLFACTKFSEISELPAFRYK